MRLPQPPLHGFADFVHRDFPLRPIFLIARGGVADKFRVPLIIGDTYGRHRNNQCCSSGGVRWKVVEQISGANPLGAMFHGVSVFYCMTTSLANNGAGLGTLGFHEAKVRELCEKAGFSSVRRVPLENPFNNLYEAKP